MAVVKLVATLSSYGRRAVVVGGVVRVATIIDLLQITIIDGRRRLQTVGVPVASSLSAPDQS
jgi:hypothetical protein